MSSNLKRRGLWLTSLGLIALASECDAKQTGTPDNNADGGPPEMSMLCDDSCPFASDGTCSDGGEGSTFPTCAFGTDCSDCGTRETPPPSNMCTPSCSGKECGSDGCGGSCGTCSEGSCNADGQCDSGSVGECDPSAGAFCEGDQLVTCMAVDSTATRVSRRCQDGCSGGECVTATRPTSVRITGNFGGRDPSFVGSPPDVAAFIGNGSTPTFTPEVASIPDITGSYGASVVVSPARSVVWPWVSESSFGATAGETYYVFVEAEDTWRYTVNIEEAEAE